MTFDLARVVRTAVSWVVKACRTKPVTSFDLPEPCEVVGRKGPVHQIIVNLVQNAVDVMAGLDAPRLEITGRVRGRLGGRRRARPWPRHRAEGTMERMFEPFFTTKKIGEGTGLGLYVSYGLAEDLGGKLEARNHPEGGAVFTLRLPLKEKSHEG